MPEQAVERKLVASCTADLAIPDNDRFRRSTAATPAIDER